MLALAESETLFAFSEATPARSLGLFRRYAGDGLCLLAQFFKKCHVHDLLSYTRVCLYYTPAHFCLSMAVEGRQRAKNVNFYACVAGGNPI